MSGINKNMGCKVTHDLNKYLEEQDKLEQITEAKQIALENDLNNSFTTGDLKEEFYYIEEGEVYTRQDVVVDQGADLLSETEAVINLLSLNVSDEVKLKTLSDIRESIFVKFGGEV